MPAPRDRLSQRLRWAAVLVAVLGLCVLGYALVSRHPPAVTPAALAQSVESEVGSLALVPSRCSLVADREWRCVVSDNASGGDATYRVNVHDDSCWDADRVAESVTEGQHMPPGASGCLH